MKLFVVSDVHGFYKEMKQCLKQAGFSEKNEEDRLIVLGDLFDRGSEAVKIFKYLKKLADKGKAIVLHGNHEDFMIDFLRGEDCSFNFAHNGFNRTLDSFLNIPAAWENFCYMCTENRDLAVTMYGKRVEPLLGDFYSIPIEVRFDVFQDFARENIKKRYKDLLPWLESLPFYYETDKYIFTHASIDGTCSDWHNPEYTSYEKWTPWQYLTWDDGHFYEKEITNTDKTVVVGHFHTDAIREIYNIASDVKKPNEILYTKQKIFIDTCTVLTKRVNVLIIEDNIEED